MRAWPCCSATPEPPRQRAGRGGRHTSHKPRKNAKMREQQCRKAQKRATKDTPSRNSIGPRTSIGDTIWNFVTRPAHARCTSWTSRCAVSSFRGASCCLPWREEEGGNFLVRRERRELEFTYISLSWFWIYLRGTFVNVFLTQWQKATWVIMNKLYEVFHVFVVQIKNSPMNFILFCSNSAWNWTIFWGIWTPIFVGI